MTSIEKQMEAGTAGTGPKPPDPQSLGRAAALLQQLGSRGPLLLSASVGFGGGQ